jgi:hypothetical protein
VIKSFVGYVLPRVDARLVVAGPPVSFVVDDPGARAVFRSIYSLWSSLPAAQRDRVTLVRLPMESRRHNARLVNALQRAATVVVKKSLAEGFGLGVTEAMWKERAVVAGAVGGIRDQILDGRNGVLVPDPHDLAGFGDAVASVLLDPGRRSDLGRAGRNSVTRRYLHDRHMAEWVELLAARGGGNSSQGQRRHTPRRERAVILRGRVRPPAASPASAARAPRSQTRHRAVPLATRGVCHVVRSAGMGRRPIRNRPPVRARDYPQGRRLRADARPVRETEHGRRRNEFVGEGGLTCRRCRRNRPARPRRIGARPGGR